MTAAQGTIGQAITWDTVHNPVKHNYIDRSTLDLVSKKGRGWCVITKYGST